MLRELTLAMSDSSQFTHNNGSEEHRLSAGSTYLLGQILRRALLDIRLLGRRGRARQAADLADAFHNLPTPLVEGRLDLERFRRNLAAYQILYPTGAAPSYDYLAAFDCIIQAEGLKTATLKL